MIFLVLGSQKFQMNRFLEAVDGLKEKGIIVQEVVVQKGYSDYQPRHLKTYDFLEKERFDRYLDQADLVMCHGGTGVIVNALKKGKKVLAVPRDQAWGEHVDQHQYQIVNLFAKLGFIEGVTDLTQLAPALEKVEREQYRAFISTNQQFIQHLRKDLEDLVRQHKS